MPPRKSDPAVQRSNTISAQFALKDDVEIRSGGFASASLPAHHPSTPAAAAAPAPAAAAPPPPPPPPATEMETDRPGEPAPLTDKEKKEGRDAVTIEDLTLPKSIITRLAKGVLPPNTQIQTNAVLAMSKSATVFISHLANAANEHTKNASKKTIMPNDVFTALEDIEFPFLRESLEAEFKKFNEVQTTKRNTYRRKVAAAKAGKAAPDAAAAATTATESSAPTTSTPKAKNDPNASTLSRATATSEPATAPRSKKQKPNGPDDSQMDVDGSAAHDGEERDASDPDTEPEQEEEEDDDDDEEEEEDEDEDEVDDDPNDDIMREAMEEKSDDDGRDEALDDGADSE